MTSDRVIYINRVQFPVTALGYGRRIGIWTQGCSIRCPGCISKDTWVTADEHRLEVEEIFSLMTVWMREADGLTVSGGEPFDQVDALRVLLSKVRENFSGDVLAYSGHPGWRVLELAPWVTELVDVLISEPYRAKAGNRLVLRGSDNQRVHLFSSLARNRYGEGIDREVWPESRVLDVCIGETGVWLAGIPRPGDLHRLKAGIALRGFSGRTSMERNRLMCRA